jgi:predicted trehalose synthase
MTMRPFLSRTFVKKNHIVTFARSTVGSAGQWQRLGTAIAKLHAVIASCFAKMAA